MMHGRGSYAFAEARDAAFVALRHAGAETFLLLGVPTGASSIAALEGSIDGGLFERVLRALRTREGTVQIPRFRVSFKLDLGARDFPEPLRTPLTLGDYGDLDLARNLRVLHSADIDVDEEGTVAVAATAVVTGPVAAPPTEPPPRPRRFVADRPFLFWLVHARTSRILLQGRVTDPSR
jgi:serpin B